MSVTDIKYKERFCKTLMNEIFSAFYARVPEAKTKTVSDNGVPKNLLPDIASKYNLERNFDKIAEANCKLDEIKIRVQEDTKKVVGNQQEIEELDRKAQDMVISAKGFEHEAKTMERQMWWRNAKIWVIIFFIQIHNKEVWL